MSGAMSNKVLTAGILGFALGILYAPRKGTETQAKLKSQIDEMKMDVENKAKRAKAKIHELKAGKDESVQEKVESKVDELPDKLVP